MDLINATGDKSTDAYLEQVSCPLARIALILSQLPSTQHAVNLNHPYIYLWAQQVGLSDVISQIGEACPHPVPTGAAAAVAPDTDALDYESISDDDDDLPEIQDAERSASPGCVATAH